MNQINKKTLFCALFFFFFFVFLSSSNYTTVSRNNGGKSSHHVDLHYQSVHKIFFDNFPKLNKDKRVHISTRPSFLQSLTVYRSTRPLCQFLYTYIFWLFCFNHVCLHKKVVGLAQSMITKWLYVRKMW